MKGKSKKAKGKTKSQKVKLKIKMEKDNKLIFKKVVIPAGKIKSMSQETKKRFIIITTMLRDLDILQKLNYFVINSAYKGKEILEGAHSSSSFFFMTTLIGKLWEIKESMEKESKKDIKSNYSAGKKDMHLKIKNIFSENGREKELFKFIRNQVAFHYEHEGKIDRRLEEIMNSAKDHKIWFCESKGGNDIFYSATEMMWKAIFSKMRELEYKGEDEDLLRQLINLIADKTADLYDLCEECLIDIIKPIWRKKKSKIELAVPLLSEVKIQFLVKP